MKAFIVLALVASSAYGISLSASTSIKVYTEAMIGHDACDSVAQNPEFVIVDKTCGSSGNCRYPDEVCVLSSGASSFFDSNSGNDYSCKQVPSACQDAVKRGKASSGGSSSGGSSSGGATTSRPTARPTERPTSAPSTSAPSTSAPSGGGRDPRCNEAFGVRGSFQSGARFSRKYGYNPSTRQCEQFIYLGTGGTRNNFATAAECQSACDGSSGGSSSGSSSSGSTDPCTLTPRQGQYARGQTCSNGARLQRRWTFESGSCRFFFYSGCNGNANNFETDEECQQRCMRRG